MTMGLDMRLPNGRCPSFLVAGCILLYVVLLCNWWSLSSKNYDLTNQINILEEQIRICWEERDQCTNDKNKLEIFTGELKVQKDHDKTDYETISKKKENNLSMCKTELESLKIVDGSKTQALNALRTSLEEKKVEIRRLNEQIKQLSSVTTDAMLVLPKSHKEIDLNEAIDGTTEPTEIKEDGERDLEMANNNNTN